MIVMDRQNRFVKVQISFTGTVKSFHLLMFASRPFAWELMINVKLTGLEFMKYFEEFHTQEPSCWGFFEIRELWKNCLDFVVEFHL